MVGVFEYYYGFGGRILDGLVLKCLKVRRDFKVLNWLMCYVLKNYLNDCYWLLDFKILEKEEM